MATVAQQEKILQTSIEELRRKYDGLMNDFDQLRVKVLAFVTGELALMTFLFATGIPVPRTVYGIVFFLAGVGCVTASFVLLVLVLRSTKWYSPIPLNNLEYHDYQKFPDQVSSLEFICECYAKSLQQDKPIYTKRAEMFDNALMLLIAGAIILLVIKYGQGVVIWHNLIQK